ncbi:MAG: substrate-binding domain-containing protein [Anaerolineae bacterium]
MSASARNRALSRRQFVKLAGAGVGFATLAACAPQVVTETVEVEKVVKETVEVEKVVKETVETVVTATPAPQGPRTIQYSSWFYGPAEEQMNKDLSALFNEKNAPDKVEPLLMPWSNYTQKLEIMTAGGVAPDIIYWDPDWAYTYFTKGWFRSLQPYFDQNPDLKDPEKYVLNAYETSVFGGEQYGVPNGTYCNLVYYNVDAFDSAGVDYPNRDWTWQDYTEASIKLTKMDGDMFEQYGTIVGNLGAYWGWQDLVWGEGSDLFDKVEMPTKCTLDNEAGYFAWQWIQDLIYKHKVAPTAAQQSALGGDFASGKVAWYIEGTWSISSYREIEAFKWDLADLPMGSKGRSNTSLFAGPYFLTQQSKSPDLAWEFLHFILGEDGQGFFAADGQATPVLKSAAESDAFLNMPGAPEHHLIRVSAVDEYARNSVYYHPKFTEIQGKIWQPEMDALLLNEKTGKDAIDSLVGPTDEMLNS